MNYQELIAKTLNGRTVYQLSKLWGIGQPRLHTYFKGERMPDFDTAWKMVEIAGVDPTEAFKAIAEETKSHKSKQFKLQMGFVQIQMCALLAIGSGLSLFILCQMARRNLRYPHIKKWPLRSHRARHVL